ncbi:MAG: hypothetical protein EYC70_01195 [Planctomycetota bacterium]|nr:MAG: hypothetical protein EYC70_01195 [Planctomycetota bacterium]
METKSEPRSSLRASSLDERAAYYRELLAEHAASGVGLKKFAEGKGVPYTTLQYWKQRGRRSRAKAPFAEVQVSPPPAVTMFELGLGQDRSLRIPHGFDAAELRRLMAALQAC